MKKVRKLIKALTLVAVSLFILVLLYTNAKDPYWMKQSLTNNSVAMESTAMNDSSEIPEATKKQVLESFGKLPLYFIENRGQIDERVAYYVQGRDITAYFTSRGITFALTDKEEQQTTSKPHVQLVSSRDEVFNEKTDQEVIQRRWVLKLDFVGANPAVNPIGKDLTPAMISYFKGPQEQWHTGLKTYATVIYPDLWTGIDLVYSGTINRLKYQFIIKPGANADNIKLAYRGATEVKLTNTGQLEVVTPVGGFHDDKPYAYQEVDGRIVTVPTSYSLEAGSEADIYGFRVGPYDKSKPLVLDPAILVYSGYIGGSNSDQGIDIAVDSDGNAYVTGQTESDEFSFPVTVGPSTTFNGFRDAFVAKVEADGTGLVYAGYIGGAQGNGIAVDSSGNAYVTGSAAPSFPAKVGPDLTFNDVFVAKVKADGTDLVYAGFIGGSNSEESFSIAVDSSGNAYVTGSTESDQGSFPVTVGPDLFFNGGTDAFVVKVKADGTGFDYAGYIGGTEGDLGTGIAVDSDGNAYVTGQTTSDQGSFPVTVGPDLDFNGDSDAFVAKVEADGTGLVYAGYIGGEFTDEAKDIAVDSSGNAYITGSTTSDEFSFPVTVGPGLFLHNPPDDSTDVFVAKVKADGTGFDYAGYIGGPGEETGFSIAVDNAGNAYVTGSVRFEFPFTLIFGTDLPITGNGVEDAFIAKVKADGTDLDFVGYIGGSGIDEGDGIAVDSAGNVYVTGFTESDEDTFPVIVGPDTEFNGGEVDAFVVKIGFSGAAIFLLIDEETIDNGIQSIEDISFNPPNCGGGDPSVCVNDDISDPGVRTLLFTRGTDVTPLSGLVLPTGEIGDEGLFRFSNPDPQVSLQNGAIFTTAEFITAMGAASDENNLDKIDGVAPLDEADILELEGETICAVVYDSDISIDVEKGFGSLKGATLGLTAFEVTAVEPDPSGSVLPQITVNLLPSSEVVTTCENIE